MFGTCWGILSLLPGHISEVVAPALVYGVVGIALVLYISLRTFGRVDVFIGTGDDLKRVYSKMATAQRTPSPPLWAFGGNLQFVPWIIYNLLSSKLFPLIYETQILTVKGLKDKTKPESEDNPRCMEDDVIVNYFPPVTKSSSSSCSLPSDAPVIIVEPGLTCTAQDIPGSSFLRRAVSRGFRVVVIERRGHARALRCPRWNLFGDS
ncbi:ABHD3, partial [Symbiodinium pilosum]